MMKTLTLAILTIAATSLVAVAQPPRVTVVSGAKSVSAVEKAAITGKSSPGASGPSTIVKFPGNSGNKLMLKN